MAQHTEVFITGIGIVSSIGVGREQFFAGLREGRKKAGQIEDFHVEEYIASEKTYLDRCSAFTLAACALALRDAGLSRDQLSGKGDQPPITDHSSRITDSPPPVTRHPSPAGLCLGTAFGCLQTMEDFFARVLEKGPRFANSLLFSHSYANSPTSLAAIEFGLGGYHSTVTSGGRSGLIALTQAIDAIRLGYADRMLAGGVDVLSRPLIQVWKEFYGDRAPGEGAAFFLLENEHSLPARIMNPEIHPRISVDYTHVQTTADASALSRVESLLGYTQGASGTLDVAAAVEKIQSGESNVVELVSKDTEQAMRIVLEKGHGE